MEKDYNQIIEAKAAEVFEAMMGRADASDMERLHRAFEMARRAHAKQKRKTGEPYILHPIAVAGIAARELMLDVNTVIAAFLHDVVEDTEIGIDEIQREFGDDVAFLVRVVTKEKKEKYDRSKQLDNFKQLLNSVQYDIRAMLVKLADRLHNMRTLESMRPDKQMKIAGETDYFYAPFANRLGYYNVKTELENLSLRFRCPHEYKQLCSLIEHDKQNESASLELFMNQIRQTLSDNGIEAKVYMEYREPYSLWRKMRKYGDDFNHLKYKHFIEIVYNPPQGFTEKAMTLRIYSILTDRFKEKPGGISNYIDSPKENGYQSFHLKLLADNGRWQEVHISSERMVRQSQLGCMAERPQDNVGKWLEKFRNTLRDIALHGQDGSNFIENVVTTFYNDDIMTFTPKGRPVVLPQRSTPIDFAFEIHSELGLHAKYARVNSQLVSIKTVLNRGDVVEVFTAPDAHPTQEWLENAKTYKARKAIQSYLAKLPKPEYDRCPDCNPIPGEEVIGFREANGRVTMHKRDCQTVIKLASQYGDSIVSVDYKESDHLFPVLIRVRGIDRYHMLIDLVDCITNDLKLSIGSFNSHTDDGIVTCDISFAVHSFSELQSVKDHISGIDGVDEVKRLD